METPAQLVAELRITAGLSQRALASRAGCTRSTIVRIEKGEMDPTITMLARIATATGHRLDIRTKQRLRKESLAAIAQLVLNANEPEIPFTHLRGRRCVSPNRARDRKLRSSLRTPSTHDPRAVSRLDLPDETLRRTHNRPPRPQPPLADCPSFPLNVAPRRLPGC